MKSRTYHKGEVAAQSRIETEYLSTVSETLSTWEGRSLSSMIQDSCLYIVFVMGLSVCRLFLGSSEVIMIWNDDYVEKPTNQYERLS
jgi:hypothetical protein